MLDRQHGVVLAALEAKEHGRRMQTAPSPSAATRDVRHRGQPRMATPIIFYLQIIDQRGKLNLTTARARPTVLLNAISC